MEQSGVGTDIRSKRERGYREGPGGFLSLAVWQLYMQQSSVMEPRGNADMVEGHDQSQPIMCRSHLLNTLHYPTQQPSSPVSSLRTAQLTGEPEPRATVA